MDHTSRSREHSHLDWSQPPSQGASNLVRRATRVLHMTFTGKDDGGVSHLVHKYVDTSLSCSRRRRREFRLQLFLLEMECIPPRRASDTVPSISFWKLEWGRKYHSPLFSGERESMSHPMGWRTAIDVNFVSTCHLKNSNPMGGSLEEGIGMVWLE
ncbi:hypothetical protein B0F90DRAFT_231132 [Multifurca ochricompacta]|uniref:Uncharacterized protein n=1 Tax=Multifurca ochricompacta TaxID=376703 RepID=A0AAD4LY92_9AGAM|nr:hypothetical protein B0F90DRAFT_231132 [Multifurca ochricompacta]